MSAVPETPTRKPNRIDATIGQRIRKKRRDQGLTADQLGALVGVTGNQIRNYETGVQRLAVARLYAISEAIGVPTSDFFAEAEVQAILTPSKDTSPDDIDADIEVILQLAKLAAESDPVTRQALRNSAILKVPGSRSPRDHDDFCSR